MNDSTIWNLQRLWPKLKWILLFVAIGHQIFYLTYHSRITYDEMLQVGAARSFLDGHHLTLQSSTPEDLAEISYTPLHRAFPPAYALIMSGLYLFFEDMGFADFFLKILASAIFFISWFAILELMGDYLGYRSRLFIWSYWGLIFSPIMVPQWTAHTTGMLSLAFFSANTACCAWAFKQERYISVIAGLGGLLMGIAIAMRYAYMPMGLILPAVFVFFAIISNRRRLHFFLAAFANGICAAMVSILFLSYNYLQFGSFFSFPAYKQGFYPQNLAMIIPFPMHVLGLMDVVFFGSRGVTRDISLPPTIPFETITIILSSLIVLTFIASFYQAFWSQKNLMRGTINSDGNNKQVAQFILIAGLVTISITVGSLAYLSIKTEKISWSGGWVYLSELRYYAATFSFFMIGIAIILSKQFRDSRLMRGLRISIIGVIIGSIILVGGWRGLLTIKQIVKPRSFPYGPFDPLGRDQPLITAFEKARKLNTIKTDQISVMTEESNLLVRGQTAALGGVDVPVDLYSEDLKVGASRLTTLFIVSRKAVNSDNNLKLQELIKRYNGQKISDNGGQEIYYFLIQPQ